MFDSQILPAPSLPQTNILLDCSLTARQIKMHLKVSILLLLCTRKYAQGRNLSFKLSSLKSCWIGLRKYHLFHNSFTKWNAGDSAWTLSLLKLSLFHWKISFLVCGMRPPIHSWWNINIYMDFVGNKGIVYSNMYRHMIHSETLLKLQRKDLWICISNEFPDYTNAVGYKPHISQDSQEKQNQEDVNQNGQFWLSTWLNWEMPTTLVKHTSECVCEGVSRDK